MAKRGDIWLVLVPFTDSSGAKVRPAVVVSWDQTNKTSDDLMVAQITTNTSRAGYLPTQVVIDVATPDGAATGLPRSSAVRCEAVTAVHKSSVRRFVGRVLPALMAKIDAALKIALDLP